jgi:hypothetical protein
MRVVNQGREPLQPLPAMQRPLTPPESQRHTPKYGGMAKSDQKLLVATREEIDLYESATDSDVEFHDFEDDNEDIVGTSTVKMSDRRVQEGQPSSTGWQINAPLRVPSPSKPTMVPRSPSPSKPIAHPRTGSQVTTPAQSRYTNSETSSIPVRSSATSSTAVTPTSPSIPTFGGNLPRSAVRQKKYDALEDILLPALDEVTQKYTTLTLVHPVSYG